MLHESDTCEFKREFAKTIKKTIVAFANTKGGTIYLGVDDDGTILGLTNSNKDVEALSSMIHDSIIPDLTAYCSIETINKEGKNIVALHVTSAPNKPYYISEKGLKPSGVYIRFGSSSINASEEVIRKMIIENQNISFETENSNNQNLTFNQSTIIFQEHKTTFSKNKYKTLKMLNGNKYNNLALLLSDQNPFTIKCAVFEGTNKIIFKDRKEFGGSILKQTNETFDYLNLNNHILSDFKGLTRVDKRDYPSFSLREALLNAIIHRNYYFNGSILVSIFDDRIEINSIGGLVSSLTLNDIYNGVSDSRNPNLAEIFHRLNYVENFGTGIGRIMMEYADYEKKPRIELSENVFKIILPNRNYIPKNNISNKIAGSTESKITNYLEENGMMKREDAEKILDMSKSGTTKVLNNLIDENFIVKEGNGKNTYYILK